MELYTFDMSPNGKRVRLVAAELGIPLELKNVDFAKGENRTPDYLAMNPMGKAPVFTDGDLTLWESGAIMCHLAQSKPGRLWPDDAQARAEALRWMFFCSCHIDPYFTTLVVERFIKGRRGVAEDEVQSKTAETRLARFMPVIEQQLSRNDYVAGSFGLGDIALGCTLELSPMVRYDLMPYPHVRAWLDRLKSRPSWR